MSLSLNGPIHRTGHKRVVQGEPIPYFDVASTQFSTKTSQIHNVSGKQFHTLLCLSKHKDLLLMVRDKEFLIIRDVSTLHEYGSYYIENMQLENDGNGWIINVVLVGEESVEPDEENIESDDDSFDLQSGPLFDDVTLIELELGRKMTSEEKDLHQLGQFP